jgi:uncharacterized damage-inducible protein DinB
MRKDEFQILWSYNVWANRRILSAVASISPAQFISPVASSFGSLRATLVHIYGAELVWGKRCLEGISPTGLPAENDFSDLESLRVAWEAEMEHLNAYLHTLDPSASDISVTYKNTKGIPFTTPLWQIIVHLVNHGTQFRSEAGMILSAWGFSPGDMDLILYLRENQK